MPYGTILEGRSGTLILWHRCHMMVWQYHASVILTYGQTNSTPFCYYGDVAARRAASYFPSAQSPYGAMTAG